MAREDYSIEEALFTAHIGEPQDVIVDDALIGKLHWKMAVWYFWNRSAEHRFEIGLSDRGWVWWHKKAAVEWHRSSLPRILKLLNDPAFRKKHELGSDNA